MLCHGRSGVSRVGPRVYNMVTFSASCSQDRLCLTTQEYLLIRRNTMLIRVQKAVGSEIKLKPPLTNGPMALCRDMQGWMRGQLSRAQLPRADLLLWAQRTKAVDQIGWNVEEFQLHFST
jgi:hypothetical protein